MSEELNQRDLINNPEKIGKYDFRNIGSTSLLQLKKTGIIHGKDYKGFEKRKPDAIISIPEVVKSKVKTTLGIVENKSTSQFKTKKQKESALQQGLEVAQILEAKFVVVTDTIDTIWANAKNGEILLDEKSREIKTTFDPKNPDLEKLIEKVINSVDENNSQLIEPRLKDPTKLAKSIWQDLWMAAGATPENCLYSFVELFIFKYLSDLNVLPNHLSYDNLMNIYKSNDDAEETLNYYAGTIRKEIKKLFKSSDKDNTTIINGTIFVSKDEEAVKGYGTVFIKILKKFGDEKEGGGELKNIDRDFKSKLFETFLKESISKKNWGQYFTPLKVVRAIAKMAQSEIKPNITMCDPACGVGKFLLEPLLINNDIEDFFPVENGVLTPKIKLIGIDKGFDKEEQKTIILAKANMLIYLSDQIRKNVGITNQFAEVFNETFELKTKNILGTLRDINYENSIDLILTNPPYVTTGSSNLKEEISKVQELKDFYKINAMGVEGLFMEWIIRSLKPGGKAFIVVPDGIFNRQNDKNLRQFLLDECLIDGIISLPLKTFFTTPKKTYILAITKKKNKAEKQTEPVFTYLVSEIGESRDIYRFDIEQNDLEKAVNLYNFFKGNKIEFNKINSDKRCKIQPIERFEPETHWSVERWWTKEEQIELGIVEEDKIVKFEEFPNLLEDIANNILSFKEELLELSQKKKSKINFKEVEIGDLFNFPSTNSKITKEFCNKNKGEIPVYASSKDEISVLGYIKDNISNIKYYDNCLSWNRNGSVGYVFIRNHRFTTNEDHRAFIIKDEYKNLLSKKYLKEIIELNLFKNGFSFLNKCGLDKIKPVKILIPIDVEGNFDLKIQNVIVNDILESNKIKSKISAYKKQIEELNVEIDSESPSKLYNVSNFFDLLSIPKKLFKKDIQEIGGIPVYSSQIENMGIIGYSNIEMFSSNEINPIITFGDHTRVFYIRKEPFAVLDNVKVLKLKDEFKNILNLDFLLYAWQEKIENIGYSRYWKYAKEINISIPINSKGEFDLEAQKEIAEKYRKIEQIKKSISAELDKIANIEIEF
jgi:type I restriction enzyme M protein